MKNYSLVLSDELQEEFFKFRNNESYDKKIIEKLLHYYKAPFLTNIAQLDRINRNTDKTLAINLHKANFKNQSLEELAKQTIYNIILCTDNDSFPYVNINTDKIENNLTGCFFCGENRTKAIQHIKALCRKASNITIYDKHFSKDTNNVNILTQLLPTQKLNIFYAQNHINESDIQKLKNFCTQWTFKQKGLTDHHDRYIEIDNKIEIILTSGFSYLGNTNKEFTYIVRNVSQRRFI